MTPDVSNILEALDLSRLSFSVIILLSSAFFSRFIKAFSIKLMKAFPDWRLRIEQTVTFVNFIIIIGSIALSVFLLFRSREAAVAIAGSLGLAFAIGAKDIAASLLSGLIVMFDRSFQVGDRIRFADIYGDVMSIGVRSTRVRTLDDSMVTVPNSQFMNAPVSSANSGALDMQVEIDIFIASNYYSPEVERLIRESAVSSRYIYLEKPIQVLFKSMFVDRVFCTRIRLKAYVIETIYEKKFESDVTERAYKALAKYNVPMPT